MHRKLPGFLLALVCVCGMAAPVSAAGSSPSISTDSAASAIAKIYEYQPLAAGRSGMVSKDALVCTVTERLYDDKGNFYLVEDSTPLSDSSLFSRSTDIDIGANIVSFIKPVADPEEKQRSCFRIMLSNEYSGQQQVITFTNTYKAKQDTVLNVRPSRGNAGAVELTVKKDAIIGSTCKLVLNDESISVTTYDKARLKALLEQA